MWIYMPQKAKPTQCTVVNSYYSCNISFQNMTLGSIFSKSFWGLGKWEVFDLRGNPFLICMARHKPLSAPSFGRHWKQPIVDREHVSGNGPKNLLFVLFWIFDFEMGLITSLCLLQSMRLQNSNVICGRSLFKSRLIKASRRLRRLGLSSKFQPINF